MLSKYEFHTNSLIKNGVYFFTNAFFESHESRLVAEFTYTNNKMPLYINERYTVAFVSDYLLCLTDFGNISVASG